MSMSHHSNTILYSNFITYKPLPKYTLTTHQKNIKQIKLTIKRTYYLLFKEKMK